MPSPRSTPTVIHGEWLPGFAAPGSAGPQTFFATGTETDSFRGMTITYPITNEETGIPAVPGHYDTTQILGFSAPGIAFHLQVSFRPAK